MKFQGHWGGEPIFREYTAEEKLVYKLQQEQGSKLTKDRIIAAANLGASLLSSVSGCQLLQQKHENR